MADARYFGQVRALGLPLLLGAAAMKLLGEIPFSVSDDGRD